MRSLNTKSVVRRATLITGAGLLAAFAGQQVGCSSGGASPGDQTPARSIGANPSDEIGSVGMNLTLQGGAMINTVSWTITGPNGSSAVVQSGTVDVTNSLNISFLVAGLFPGNGYVITLTGTSTDGTVTCAGSATFSIVARSTTTVNDVLQCNPTPGEAGSAMVNGSTYNCAAWGSIAASPSETTVGHSVSLSATATGVDPSGLTYAWSAPAGSGSFSAPTSANTSFTCAAAGTTVLTLTVGDGPVPDGGSCNPALTTTTIPVTCDAPIVTDGGGPTSQALVTSIDVGVVATRATINLGTAIGQGVGNGGTPGTLTDLAADPNNSETITADGGAFFPVGNVPDKAAGFCTYPADGGAPTRIMHITGATFESSDAGLDPVVPMAPAYFPLVYNTTNTTTGNAFGGQPPIIGLFDWRPKDIDESVVVAESDDNGKSWYFMQNVLDLRPDYTNPVSGGYSDAGTASNNCPSSVTGTHANDVSPTGSVGDDGWGHASIIQLPGAGNIKTGQFLYMLDRNGNGVDGGAAPIDNAPLRVINLKGSSNKFPIWNTNNSNPGANDMKSISSVLQPTVDAGSNLIVLQNTTGLLNPDGIMAVFPTQASAVAGSPVTVLYVQKILNGDNTGATALPVAQQCTSAPFSHKVNHDIAYVRLATTTDGVNFTDLGIVQGLSDPTTVDYNKTRWVAPRGTLLDVNGDGSVWGLYFSAGNCLDGDSDAFHYIGYAESTDKMHWTVFNDINHPIASINPITTTNQATGTTVTIPATPPLVTSQSWFAERLYAPTATRIDATHLSLTFAGYGVQTPNNDLLNYRAIGNIVVTVSKPLPAGVPNNINTH